MCLRLMEIERGSIRSHPVENVLWKRLRTCRETDYRMNELMNFSLTSSAIKQVRLPHPAPLFWLFFSPLPYPACVSLPELTVLCMAEAWDSSVNNLGFWRLGFNFHLQIRVEKVLASREKRPERQADNWLSSSDDFEYACVPELLPSAISPALPIYSLVGRYR